MDGIVEFAVDRDVEYIEAIMNTNKTKVLFITGSGRCGSTILHDILGQVDGFTAIGELRYLWERSFIKNRLCGCRLQFSECDLWRAAVHEAFGGVDYVDAQEMSRLTDSFRLLHLPLTLLPYIRRRLASQLNEYLDNFEKLFRAIQATTGCRLIIDSSKVPQYGYLLRMIPMIELYVVHLIRDPRAVAYSWSRKRIYEPDITNPEYMVQKNSISSSLQWIARNITAEIYLRQKPVRYMMLRYEDLINKPKESVKCILSMLEETAEDLSFIKQYSIKINKANHSVFGNPVRFRTGAVELKVDNEWKARMRRLSKISVMALTWPLLLKYRYLI